MRCKSLALALLTGAGAGVVIGLAVGNLPVWVGVGAAGGILWACGGALQCGPR